jgi:hypothetical protein
MARRLTLCRFRRRTSVAAFEWISLSSASRTHLAARRSQAALLSRDRVNLAIARHSPANLLNSSDGFMLVVLPRVGWLIQLRPHFRGRLKRDNCTDLNSRLGKPRKNVANPTNRPGARPAASPARTGAASSRRAMLYRLAGAGRHGPAANAAPRAQGEGGAPDRPQTDRDCGQGCPFPDRPARTWTASSRECRVRELAKKQPRRNGAKFHDQLTEPA